MKRGERQPSWGERLLVLNRRVAQYEAGEIVLVRGGRNALYDARRMVAGLAREDAPSAP